MSRLLVVEDSPEVRHVVVTVLQRAGHQVVAVASCAAGIAAVTEEGPFDVLVLDHDLGDGVGTDVLAAAERRTTGRADRTIFITGNPTIKPLIRTAAPAARIMAKPFEIDALLAAVAELVSCNAGR